MTTIQADTMTDYTYITPHEVRHVCENLTLPDWTQLKNGKIATADADKIRNVVGSEALNIPVHGEFKFQSAIGVKYIRLQCDCHE